MSLTVEERKDAVHKRSSFHTVKRKVYNTKEQKLLFGLLFRAGGKYLSFTLTARVAGSTHSVLLEMNVIFVKECEESKSTTP